MALPLTPERLRLLYDFLAECPPFNGWNLPAGEDVLFKVNRHAKDYGQHRILLHNDLRRQHEIQISGRNVTNIDTLMHVMAHEMVHVHEQANEICTPHQAAKHPPAFWAYAREVCESLGFNPDRF